MPCVHHDVDGIRYCLTIPDALRVPPATNDTAVVAVQRWIDGTCMPPCFSPTPRAPAFTPRPGDARTPIVVSNYGQALTIVLPPGKPAVGEVEAFRCHIDRFALPPASSACTPAASKPSSSKSAPKTAPPASKGAPASKGTPASKPSSSSRSAAKASSTPAGRATPKPAGKNASWSSKPVVMRRLRTGRKVVDKDYYEKRPEEYHDDDEDDDSDDDEEDHQDDDGDEDQEEDGEEDGESEETQPRKKRSTKRTKTPRYEDDEDYRPSKKKPPSKDDVTPSRLPSWPAGALRFMTSSNMSTTRKASSSINTPTRAPLATITNVASSSRTPLGTVAASSRTPLGTVASSSRTPLAAPTRAPLFASTREPTWTTMDQFPEIPAPPRQLANPRPQRSGQVIVLEVRRKLWLDTMILLWLREAMKKAKTDEAIARAKGEESFRLFHSANFADLSDKTFAALVDRLAKHEMVVLEVRGHIILVKRKVGERYELGQHSAIELGAFLRGLTDLEHTRLILCLMPSFKLLFLETIEQFAQYYKDHPEARAENCDAYGIYLIILTFLDEKKRKRLGWYVGAAYGQTIAERNKDHERNFANRSKGKGIEFQRGLYSRGYIEKYHFGFAHTPLGLGMRAAAEYLIKLCYLLTGKSLDLFGHGELAPEHIVRMIVSILEHTGCATLNTVWNGYPYMSEIQDHRFARDVDGLNAQVPAIQFKDLRSDENPAYDDADDKPTRLAAAMAAKRLVNTVDAEVQQRVAKPSAAVERLLDDHRLLAALADPRLERQPPTHGGFEIVDLADPTSESQQHLGVDHVYVEEPTEEAEEQEGNGELFVDSASGRISLRSGRSARSCSVATSTSRPGAVGRTSVLTIAQRDELRAQLAQSIVGKVVEGQIVVTILKRRYRLGQGHVVPQIPEGAKVHLKVRDVIDRRCVPMAATPEASWMLNKRVVCFDWRHGDGSAVRSLYWPAAKEVSIEWSAPLALMVEAIADADERRLYCDPQLSNSTLSGFAVRLRDEGACLRERDGDEFVLPGDEQTWERLGVRGTAGSSSAPSLRIRLPEAKPDDDVVLRVVRDATGRGPFISVKYALVAGEAKGRTWEKLEDPVATCYLVNLARISRGCTEDDLAVPAATASASDAAAERVKREAKVAAEQKRMQARIASMMNRTMD